MRRIIALFLIVLTAAAFTACGGTKPTEPATEKPTESPYLATPVDEPEWTYADGKLRLEDSKNIYAEGEDFLCFAIVGAEKESMELRFMFNDTTASMLREQTFEGNLYITFNEQMIGIATLSDDCKIATVASKDAQGDITSLATLIRGVG